MNKYILLISLGMLLPKAGLYAMDNTHMQELDECADQVPSLDEDMKKKYKEKRDVLDGQIQELWHFLNQVAPDMEKELIESGCDQQEVLHMVESLQLSLAKTHVRLVRLDHQINDKK